MHNALLTRNCALIKPSRTICRSEACYTYAYISRNTIHNSLEIKCYIVHYRHCRCYPFSLFCIRLVMSISRCAGRSSCRSRIAAPFYPRHVCYCHAAVFELNSPKQRSQHCVPCSGETEPDQSERRPAHVEGSPGEGRLGSHCPSG